MSQDPKDLGNQLLQRAWNRDGLPELMTGLFFLVAAALIAAPELLPRHSVGWTASVLAFAIGVPVLTMLGPKAVKAARNRWLLSRSGYVEYLPRKRSLGRRARALVPMAGLILAAWFAMDRWDRALLPITGAAGALLSTLVGRKAGLPRLVIAGFMVLAASLLLAWSRVNLMIGMAMLFGFQGVLCLAIGGATMTRFLRDQRTAGQ